MFTSILGIALALGASAPAVPHPLPASAVDRISTWMHASADPRITVWTNHDESPYHRGDRVRVYVRPENDGYITVVRIDTDGRVRVLFPREPWEDNFARGGRTFEVLDRGQRAFQVDDYPGVGYVFAISSPDPFDFDPYVLGDHWDYRTIADGRVRGDPYVTATDFAARIANRGTYDYDLVPYYVEQHYDYPRFVCYDCHTYVSYRYWDPYRYHCSRFRLVIYDNWYYYPYRRYPGRRVVIRRPRRPEPRYVFKDYDGRSDYVTRVRQRPTVTGRRTIDIGRTSADVGGRGSIPAPIEGRRRVNGRSDNGAQPQDRRAIPGQQPRVEPNVDRGRTEAPGDRRTVNPGQDRNQGNDRQPADRRTVDPGNGSPPSSGDRRTVEPNRDLRPTDSGRDTRSQDSRRAQPSRPAPSDQPRQSQPQRPSSQGRPDSRAAPRRSQPPPQRAGPSRAEPRRSEPSRAEPSRQPRSSQPVLRRRKPDNR